MHGRSTHPGSPPAVRPAFVAGRTAVPATETPPAPGTRTTSPGATTPTLATLPHARSGGAVVHVGRTEARVARDLAAGQPQIVSVPRRSRARRPEAFLDRILLAVGDRSPLVIAGSEVERAALEQQLGRLGGSPDRWIDDPAVDASDESLRLRLRALHSHPG